MLLLAKKWSKLILWSKRPNVEIVSGNKELFSVRNMNSLYVRSNENRVQYTLSMIQLRIRIRVPLPKNLVNESFLFKKRDPHENTKWKSLAKNHASEIIMGSGAEHEELSTSSLFCRTLCDKITSCSNHVIGDLPNNACNKSSCVAACKISFLLLSEQMEAAELSHPCSYVFWFFKMEFFDKMCVTN